MYKWIIGAIVGFSLLASFSLLKFGVGPRAIPIIKASNFEEPETLGLYIHRQLYQRLNTSTPIGFGFNKENPYEQKVVNSVINYITEDKNKSNEKMPKIVLLSVSEAESATRREMPLVFTLVNLENTEVAADYENCETHPKSEERLICLKKQKLREINRAKKVDLKKPIAIVETESQSDIVIYIKQ
jgi:hypothetical protein